GFYPEGLPQRLWLEYYAEHFATVEVNNAFYRLPERNTFAQWRERTPDGFCMAVKMSRYLTHIKRLKDPQEPVARFFSRAEALGDRLGPVLIQLPPTLKANVDALAETLACFPDGTKVAVEPRHQSWWADDVRRLLEKHNAALCWADRLGRPIAPLWRTADWGYLRLHEGRAQPRPRYGRAALKTWVSRIAEAFPSEEPVYVYFNNDHGGAAIVDAKAFLELAQRARLGSLK
ncbi:MAG TPA: DUF72 domain-containing protein, partial [Micromonosporaceae bacterium]|nr:DUF72 domain-containing protein [Micromonosporaceae bacterium]